MAQNIFSSTRSLSDSEINERHFKQPGFEHQRTKRYSGSHITPNTTAKGYFNYPIKSLVDYDIPEDGVATCAEEFEGQTRPITSDIVPAVSSSIPIFQGNIYLQNQFKTPRQGKSLGGIDLSAEVQKMEAKPAQLILEKSIGGKEPTAFDVSMPKVISSNNLLTENKNSPEKEYTCQRKHPIGRNISVDNPISYPILDTPEKNTTTFPILGYAPDKDTGTSPLLDVPDKNSILYPPLEDTPAEKLNVYPIQEVPTKDNFLVPSEDFIGEPRCVALKKYTTDDDMEDALELNFAEFEEDEESMSEQQQPKSSTKKEQKKNPNDMFLDDEDPIDLRDSTNIPYIDLANPKKNWEKPTIEKEEGELTPDLYSTTLSDGESRKSRAVKNSNQGTEESNREKKPVRKESNQDFFLKINRCFRKLEREFCNMHVPRGSRRMIGQLQNTLCNVDRMKRRLTFLIDSAKHRSRSKSKSDTNSKDDRHASKRRGSVDESRSKSSRLDSGKAEKINSLLRDSIRSQKAVEVKMNRHIRRTAATIAYAGTKQEKQRIQSLFKRQMNLITQHVIQRNDTGKGLNSKAGGMGTKKTIETVTEGPKAPELKTLDEMEAFLAVLKVQKSQKDEILAKESQKKQQGPLRFTTKKYRPVVGRRLQPVLLLGKNTPQILSAENQDDDAEWKKQAEVLQAMSEKRKEILENKKEYEEVRVLQEQLDKLTNMNISSELKVSMNARNTKSQKSAEQSTIMRETKSRKIPQDIPVKEIESGKNQTTSKEELKEKSQDEKVEGEKSISKNDLKEIESTNSSIQIKSSDFEPKSRQILCDESEKRRRGGKVVVEANPNSETSGSDGDLKTEQKDQILKKRKRNESVIKLLPAERTKRHSESKGKSQKYHLNSNIEEASDGNDKKISKELSRKLLIVGNKNMALLNERFCLKVIGNQIYLKKVGENKRLRKSGHREQRNSRRKSNKQYRQDKEKNEVTIDEEEQKESTQTLQEMEEFLQQLRAKKKASSEDRDHVSKLTQQSRETKFMARIQAKRKAKLMACVSSETKDISEKEAKFLKDLESRSRDPADSPDTEKKKQKLMQKIREETDAIVLSQKQTEDDPLSDVKTFLNMIKEAESVDDEKSKQFCVSFSMKRSDVKQLESITTGKTSALTEESQKFLNSVRAKMRAKKAPNIEVGNFPG